MSAPLGEARVRVEADADDFGDSLDQAVTGALEEVVRAAAAAFGTIETRASAAGEDMGDAVRDGARAAQNALNGIDSSSLDNVRQQAAQAGAALQDARQRESRASAEAASAERELREVLGRSNATVDELVGATNRLEAAQTQSRNASRDAAEAADRQQRAQDQLNDSTREGDSAASGLGDSIGSMVGKLAGAAIGLAGVAAAADTMWESFDRQDMANKLGAQLNLTAEESAEAGRIAGSVYAQNYGESMQDVTDAAGAILSTLGNLADDGGPAIEDLTKKALTLAQTFGVDVAEATQSANNLIRTGMAKDGVEAFDLIGRAMQNVPAQMRDELLPVMDEYSTYLQSLGFDGQEAFGLIVNAAQGGSIEMDKAGDALKEFQIRATDMSKTSGDAYAALGLNQADMTAALLAGGDTAKAAFDQIIGGLTDMTDPVAQSQAALALFGTPLEDMNVQKIPSFLLGLKHSESAIGDFNGSVDEMGNRLAEGPNAKLELFKRGVQDAMITGLGQAAGYLLEHRTLLYVLAGVLGTVVIGYAAVRVAAVISAVAQGIHAAATGGNTAALAANRIAMGAAAITAGVMRVGTLLGAGAMGIATAATWAFNAAMAVLTSPITLVVVAIAAVVAGLVWFFTQTELGKTIISAAWEFIKNVFSSGWEFIKSVFTWFGDAWTWVADKATAFWTDTIQPVLSWIGDAFALLWSGIELYFRLWGAAFEVVGTGLRMLWDNFIFPILAWIGDRFVWLWDTVISPVIGWIVGKFNEWVDGMKMLWDFVWMILQWVGDRFMWLWDNMISPVIGWIVGKIVEFGNMMGWLWGKFSEAVGWIFGKLGELGSFFGGIIGDILGFLGNAGSALYNWGRDLIQGLLNGAGSLLSSIGNFFLDKIPGWIKEPFKKAMGIASPSKVFAGYGTNLGEGLIAGVEAMTTRVQSASQDMADAAGNVTMPSITAGPIDVTAATGVISSPTPTVAGPIAPVGVQPVIPDLSTAVPQVDALGEGLTAAKDAVIDPALTGMTANVDALANSFPTTNTDVIQPALTAMGAGLVATKDAVVDPALWGIQGNMAWTGQMTADTVNGVVLPQWNNMGAGIQAVKAGSIDPAFAGIQGGLLTVQGAFATGVGAISSQWDQMRGAVGRPVRFAIDTVFNNGLVGMWNSVSDLIGTQKMNPYQAGGFAAGSASVLPGYKPGIDDMPFVSADGRTQINLGGGEGIARPEFVAAMGPSAFDAANMAARTGGISAVKRQLGNYAFGGSIDSSLWRAASAAFPNATMNSALRPGASGYHGKGQAVDLGGPMQQIANWIYKTYPGSAQLIYGPGPVIAEGNTNQAYARNYFRDDLAGHYDHVHWASKVPVDSLGAMVSTDSGSGGAVETFDVGAFVNGKLGEERKKIQESIAGFGGAGTIGTLPQKTFDSMNTAMQTKIDAGIAAAQAAGAVSMGSSANMMEHAKAIADSAKARGMGREGALIGLMTGLAESGIRILANPAVPESFSFPHDGVGNDHDSTGIFQQRQAGWGTLAQRMNARGSADLFFNKLGTFNWRGMDAGAAAQKVQVSAVPDAYGRQRGRAAQILDSVFDEGGVANGRGLMLKDVIRPERTLSPEQTEAFERLLPLLQNLTATGSGELNIGGLTLRGGGKLEIKDGVVNAQGQATVTDGKRTVLVTQYISGGNAQETADETSKRLLALLP